MFCRAKLKFYKSVVLFFAFTVVVLFFLKGLYVKAENCGCVQSGSLDVPPCEEVYSGGESYDPFNSPPWKWELSKMVGSAGNEEKKEQPDAELAINVFARGVGEDNKVGATAQATNFRTNMMENGLFSWCVQDSATKQKISYNTVVAGGELAELSGRSPAPGSGQCCDYITRTPSKDTDNDGMDDYWEEENFVGREVNGVLIKSIGQVLPDDDPDKDGYFAKKFFNKSGEYYVTAVPGMEDSIGNIFVAGGEAEKWRNIQEYIAGTNPLVPDTDGDGYSDEADYVGQGQIELSFPADRQIGPNGYYDIFLTAVGIDMKRNVAIAQAAKKTYLGSEGNINVQLNADRKTLPTTGSGGDMLTLKADVLNGDLEKDSLYYKWEFGGADICDKEKFPAYSHFCNLGQGNIQLGGNDELSFRNLPGIENLSVGDVYKFKVRVIDPKSRREAENSVDLKISHNLSLKTACGENIEERDTVPYGGKIPVGICASEGSFEKENQKFNFQWFVDGQNDKKGSGLGKNIYILYSTKPVGDYHTITLKLVDNAKGEVMAEGSIKLRVSGPIIEIVQPEDRFEYSDPVAGEESRFVSEQAGKSVEFVAKTDNFNVGSNYHYAWKVGGDLYREVDTTEFDDVFNFVVPDDAKHNDVYDISVQVRGIDEDGEVSEARDNIKVRVGVPRSTAGSFVGFWSGLASVSKYMPKNFGMSVKVGIILAGFAMVVLGVAFISGKILIQ